MVELKSDFIRTQVPEDLQRNGRLSNVQQVLKGQEQQSPVKMFPMPIQFGIYGIYTKDLQNRKNGTKTYECQQWYRTMAVAAVGLMQPRFQTKPPPISRFLLAMVRCR